VKVLDLQCAAGHGFEGWFGSEDDYAAQQARGLLTCPTCSSAEVRRLPSAPRLNLGAGRADRAAAEGPGAASAAAGGAPSKSTQVAVDRAPTASGDGPSPAQRQAMEATYLQAVRHLIANTEDVGPRFADEVRRIHHGEVEHRAIRGQASPEESRELREEGIEVLSLPIPVGLDRPLQ
jgi:hypothetical protein